jgi:hypothetical protein
MDKFYDCIKEICSNYRCFNDLKKISYDKDKKEFLCNCNTQRIDFDDFSDKYYGHPNPPSVDTIFFDKIDKKIYLIEFKNQKCSKIDNIEIKNKVKSSIEILKDLAKKCNVKFKNYYLYICIIYSDGNKWKRGVCSNTIQFGLEYFKEQGLVKDIKTNDIEWFKSQYVRIKDNLL